MGYVSKVRLIERANRTRQFYHICPAPLAEALELEKGESREWVVEDGHTLVSIRRSDNACRNEGLILSSSRFPPKGVAPIRRRRLLSPPPA